MIAFPYEDRLNSPFNSFIIYLVLAMLIFIAAEIGRFVGLELLGLKISILWPAAGISLAGMLLFGFNVWPGILLGNLCYNIFYLYYFGTSFIAPMLIGTIISLSSTAQAIVGSFLIRNLSTSGLFNNLKDVFVFLCFGGLFTCLIASSISVPALLLGGYLEWSQASFTWLTFWIGDTTGVYVITPLIITWATKSLEKMSFLKKIEAFIIFIVFLLLCYVNLVINFPFVHWYIPLLIWVTFRFGWHGATLILFLMTFTIIIATSFGYGPFFAKIVHFEPMLTIVTFLEILIATTLILAGALNERMEAWNLLQRYNKNLEEIIQVRTKQLNEMRDTVNLKQKLVSLGMLTAGIGHEIKAPLKVINDYSKGGEDCIFVLKDLFKKNKGQLNLAISAAVENTLETLNNCMTNIKEAENRANKIVDDIIQKAVTEREGSTEFKSINLHVLLNHIVEQLKRMLNSKFPEFNVEMRKEYSHSVGMIPGIPEDLSRVFFQIIDNSWHALKEKKDKLGDSYHPDLVIKTIDKKDTVEIVIYDNGIGIPTDILVGVFEPFFSTKLGKEGIGLGLAIAHDIIVQEHQGNIIVDSEEGEYTQVKVILPKLHGG